MFMVFVVSCGGFVIFLVDSMVLMVFCVFFGGFMVVLFAVMILFLIFYSLLELRNTHVSLKCDFPSMVY